MTNDPDFFNVKINVNGKVHNVKIEKGVNLSTSEGIFSVFGDNQLDKVDYVPDKYDTYKYGGQVSQLNMSEAEFSIFKNVADNVQENGDSIVLSKKDVEEAETLFRLGEFTNDIKENIPKGYKAYRYDQELNTKSPDNYSLYSDEAGENVWPTRIAGHLEESSTSKDYRVGFIINDMVTDTEIKFAKNHPDTEFYEQNYGEDGHWESSSIIYTDNDNVTRELEGEDLKESNIRYDENGKHVDIYNHYDEYGNKRLEHKEVTYVNEKDRRVKEEYYNGELNTYKEWPNADDDDWAPTVCEKNYADGKLKREYHKYADKSVCKDYDANEKVSKIEVEKDGYYYEYDVKKDKLTISKDYKKVLEKQGDKTTHYIDGMTWDEYIMKDLRGEIK